MLPLQPISFCILCALADEEKLHGYEIKKMVEAEMGKSTPTATLYRYFRNMQKDNLIEIAEKPKENDDPRRQYFKLTSLGVDVYSAERKRLKRLLDNAPAIDTVFSSTDKRR